MPASAPADLSVPAADLAGAELPPDFVAASRERFARFVEGARNAAGNGTLVLCHSDADGLAAGAILTAVLRRAGLPNVEVVATGKAGSAWSDETAGLLAARRPGALLVTDLGVRSDAVWDGPPPLFIDHHRPSGLPAPETVITGYGVEPTPTSGILALMCAGGLEGVESDDLGWIAAVSALSDLGDKAPFGLIAAEKKRHGVGVLRDSVTLLNAPRRSPSGNASAALELLLSAAGPRDIAKGEGPLVESLRRDKEEVNAAYNEAKKAGPKFAGEAAAIRIHTPCQVHPLVAQIWRTRLPKFIVMGVNTGYRPGWVHFSARCGKDKNLLDFFRAHRPEGADSMHYGNGHDQAGGGALPTAVWNIFARDLGFGPEMLVDETAPPTSAPAVTAENSEPELFPAS